MLRRVNLQQWLMILGLGTMGLFAAGAMIWAMIQFQRHPELLADPAKQPDQPVEKAQGQTITLTETVAGKRKWVFALKELHYAKSTNQAEMIGVTGAVYGEDEAVMFTFTAPKGTYLKDKREVTLAGGAKLIAPKNKIELTAPTVHWGAQKGEIDATGGVVMNKGDFGISRCQRLTTTMDFELMRMTGGTLTEVKS